MERIGRAPLVMLLWLVLAAPAGAQTLTLVNRAGVGARQERRVERAVELQVRRDFAPRWPSAPVTSITFGRHGWRFVLGSSTTPGLRNVDFYGWHSVASGRPFGMVGVGGLYNPWSYTLSHETLETAADPYVSNRHEVCDPVEGWSYRIGAVRVSDFVLPAWYVPGSRGPWDFLGRLTGAGQVARGRAPVNP